MYAKYVTNPSSTLANIIADLAALLAGGSIASLSASCDKVNSTLVSTVAPGWTAFDVSSSVANSGRVVSCADNSALTTKYANLQTPGAGQIDLLVYDTFNAGTHTGTNASTALAANLSGLSTTVVNVIAIWCTPRSFYIQGVTTATGGIGCFEYTRETQFLVGTTYPVACALDKSALASASAINGQTSRIKNMGAAGDTTGAGATVRVGSISPKYSSGVKNNGVANLQVRDNADALYMELRPIYAMSPDYGTQLRSQCYGRLYDVLDCTWLTGANTLDTFSDGTDTYSYVVLDATDAIAFKNS
jgi:hypothetical protein